MGRCGGETRLQASLGDGLCSVFWCCDFFLPHRPKVTRPAPQQQKRRWAHLDRPVPRGPVLSRPGCVAGWSRHLEHACRAGELTNYLTNGHFKCSSVIPRGSTSRHRLSVECTEEASPEVLLHAIRPCLFGCCGLLTPATQVSTHLPPKSPGPGQEWDEGSCQIHAVRPSQTLL